MPGQALRIQLLRYFQALLMAQEFYRDHLVKRALLEGRDHRHFVGASPDSTDVQRTLRRLCYELKAGCADINADIPDDPEELHVAFSDFLRQAAAKRRVVLLLDAIDQFDPASHATGLH